MTDLDIEATAALVGRAQSGDGPATDELFERYLPVVRRVVALRMGVRLAELAESEDLVQEALLEAFRSLDGFVPRSQGSFRNWLATVAENRIRDVVRRAHAEKRGAGRARTFSAADSGSLSSSIFAGNEPTPSEMARGSELEERLERALLALDERDRRVIELRRLTGMTYEEIAAELELGGASSARSLFARALGKLSDSL